LGEEIASNVSLSVQTLADSVKVVLLRENFRCLVKIAAIPFELAQILNLPLRSAEIKAARNM
jgi:hypothetical protein